MTKVTIQKALSSDQLFLEEMLYQSLYVPEGKEPFSRDILKNPDIAKYVSNWGKTGDLAFIARDKANPLPIAAIWLRLFKSSNRGYGYINDEIPEVGIAVLAQYRGQGIGSLLFQHLFKEASSLYNSISLSVSVGNPALHLYEKLGFIHYSEEKDSCIMVKSLMHNSNVRPPGDQTWFYFFL